MEWESLPSSESTWEDLERMRHQFPEFILEDKDSLEGNGNDTQESRGLKNAYNRARRAKMKAAQQTSQQEECNLGPSDRAASEQ